MPQTNSAAPSPKGPVSIKNLLLGNGFILLSTIFFGVDIPVVKLLAPKWMTVTDITLFRIICGCVLMWITTLFIKTDRIRRDDWLKIILGGAIGLFFFLYLFNLALQYANPIDVSIIMTFPPIFVILIGFMFQHRRPSGMEWLGVVVSFVGAAIVIAHESHGSEPKPENELLGEGLAFVSSACYAFYLVILEKPSHEYKSFSLLRWVFLFACIPAVFFLKSVPEAPLFHTTDPTPWLLIAYVILGPTYISYFLETPAIKLIGSELVSLYQYLVPVVAIIASVLLKVAFVEWAQIIAMLVIIGGMVLTDYGKRRRLSKQSEQK